MKPNHLLSPIRAYDFNLNENKGAIEKEHEEFYGLGFLTGILRLTV